MYNLDVLKINNFEIKKSELNAVHEALNLETPSNYSNMLGENIIFVE